MRILARSIGIASMCFVSASFVGGCRHRDDLGAGDPTSRRVRIMPDSNDPLSGVANAPITAVVFVDYQCPYSAQAVKLLEEPRQHGDVRVVYKQLPVPGHMMARGAARAALAAARQGRFDDMSRALFQHQDDLARPSLLARARQLGLDMARFERDLDAADVDQHIDDDLAEASRLGLDVTPAIFFNGVYVKGAPKPEELAEVIDYERKYVSDLEGRGVQRAQVYREIMRHAHVAAAEESGPHVQRLNFDEHYQVPVSSGDAQRGNADAEATLVMFADLTCPHSAALQKTVSALEQRYKDRLRVVWKNYPSSSRAMLAHQALVAARAQGRFWDVADALFRLKGDVTRDKLRDVATHLGLDAQKLAQDMESPATYDAIANDLRLGRTVGVDGTPTIFVNGAPKRGVWSADEFARLIDQELDRAASLVRYGTPRDKLYGALIADGHAVAEVPEPTTVGAALSSPSFEGRVHVTPTALDPQRGPADAKVTIVMFGDFQCPYSAQGAQMLKEMDQLYPGALRVIFKHLPLQFHRDARNAAAAAMAAGELGKFWEMHDWLFSHQNELDMPGVLKGAREIGLDPVAFRRAFDDRKITDDRIKAAEDYASAIGVDGAPLFLVNGRVIPGTPPAGMMQATIEAELRHAEKVAVGDPAAKGQSLYERILQTSVD